MPVNTVILKEGWEEINGGKESNKLQEARGKNMSELMVIISLTASKAFHGSATGQI